MAGHSFLHGNIKKGVLNHRNVKELTSVCPGSVVLSDNETPFPWFSSAKEPQKMISSHNLWRYVWPADILFYLVENCSKPKQTYKGRR